MLSEVIKLICFPNIDYKEGSSKWPLMLTSLQLKLSNLSIGKAPIAFFYTAFTKATPPCSELTNGSRKILKFKDL